MIDGQLLKSALIGIIILAGGAYLSSKIPSPKDIREDPFVRVAKAGEPVALRAGTVKLLRTDVSDRVFVPRQTASTGANVTVSQHGAFVVATVEVSGRDGPESFSNVTLVDRRGRTFGGPQPIGDNACGYASPGLPMRCQLVFEIDKSALAGMKLRIPSSTTGGDDVAEIDLAIDDAKAKQLLTNVQSIKVSAPELAWSKPL